MTPDGLDETTAKLRDCLGRLSPDTDPRLDRPLAEQLDKLINWATSQRPDKFRRSVPVAWDDHDILICNVVAKLVERIEALELATYEYQWPVYRQTDQTDLERGIAEIPR